MAIKNDDKPVNKIFLWNRISFQWSNTDKNNNGKIMMTNKNRWYEKLFPFLKLITSKEKFLTRRSTIIITVSNNGKITQNFFSLSEKYIKLGL